MLRVLEDTAMTTQPLDLTRDVVVYKPDWTTDQLPVTDKLYETLEKDYEGFKNHSLVSCYQMETSWNYWECHPAGDETIVLISGAIDLILEDMCVALRSPGDTFVVPKGCWHTADISEPCKVLFITPGENTSHRPRS
jgi:uncharacterized cupin superfamily protein